MNKAERAVAVMQFVNSAPQYKAFPVKFDESTAEEMIRGCDVVVDALDNIESRLVLEKMCSRFKVPLVFGAVSGWTGTISTILPGHPKLEDYYKNSQTQIKPSVLPFTAATVGSWQTAEVVKVLLGRPNLVDKLLLIDLEDNATEILPF